MLVQHDKVCRLTDRQGVRGTQQAPWCGDRARKGACDTAPNADELLRSMGNRMGAAGQAPGVIAHRTPVANQAAARQQVVAQGCTCRCDRIADEHQLASRGALEGRQRLGRHMHAVRNHRDMGVGRGQEGRNRAGVAGGDAGHRIERVCQQACTGCDSPCALCGGRFGVPNAHDDTGSAQQADGGVRPDKLRCKGQDAR